MATAYVSKKHLDEAVNEILPQKISLSRLSLGFRIAAVIASVAIAVSVEGVWPMISWGAVLTALCVAVVGASGNLFGITKVIDRIKDLQRVHRALRACRWSGAPLPESDDTWRQYQDLRKERL